MKRAAILQGCFRNEIKHAPRHHGGEWIKLIVFCTVCGVIIGAIFPNLNWIASALLSGAGGYIILIGWNTWRARAELSAMAFKVWMGRATAIARQYDVDLTDDPHVWEKRWRGGLSPDQAVKQELDARDFANGRSHVEPDQPWPRR